MLNELSLLIHLRTGYSSSLKGRSECIAMGTDTLERGKLAKLVKRYIELEAM